MTRHRSALSMRSFRSYQGDKARPLTPSQSTEPHALLFDPFLSPAKGSPELLKSLIPEDVVIYTCEYDMLQAEGERFAGALAGCGKRVCYKKVSKVPHAWDKSPGIISWGEDAVKGREKVAEVYMEVCGVIGAVLGIKAKVVDEMKKEGRRSWLWRRGSKKGKANSTTESGMNEEKVLNIKDSKGHKHKEADRRSKELKKSSEFTDHEPLEQVDEAPERRVSRESSGKKEDNKLQKAHDQDASTA